MDIATTVEAAAAACGFLGVVIAFVFQAGKFTQVVESNRQATDKLTNMIDGHLTWSAEMAREYSERFHDHDTRLIVLEKTGH